MNWNTYPTLDVEFESFARIYRNSALFEICMYWIENGEKQSPRELADIIIKIIINTNQSI